MNDIYQSLLRLKNKLLINYAPEEVSYLAMEILNKYSLCLDNKETNMMLEIIAMDMGEEFVLSQAQSVWKLSTFFYSPSGKL